MKIKFSNNIVAEQYEKANVWKKCEMVILAFCEFVYLFLMTVLSIVKNVFEWLQQFGEPKEKPNAHHHCEQVQQMQQSLHQILDELNHQPQFLQSILRKLATT